MGFDIIEGIAIWLHYILYIKYSHAKSETVTPSFGECLIYIRR